jgi:hypothetical protein
MTAASLQGLSTAPVSTDVIYTTMTGSLSVMSSESGIANGDGHHQYFMAFTGCNLQEKVLKDWLRSCTKQVTFTGCNLQEKGILSLLYILHLLSVENLKKGDNPELKKFHKMLIEIK